MDDLDKLARTLTDGTIKALSIKQPWAHNILHDGKDVENRDWPTRGRGWFLIHAGKSPDGVLPRALADVPRGGIVGAARIVDCVTEWDSKWWIGRYGFVLRNAFPLPFIPCRGQLGFFKPPQDVIDAVGLALKAHIERNERD